MRRALAILAVSLPVGLTVGCSEAETGGSGSGGGGDTAIFKVTGDAPKGVDITYGTDSTNRQGTKPPFEKELAVKDDALFYQVTAQLKGGGDIRCSVTIGDKTKRGRAEGGFNICSAQLNSGEF